MVDIDTRELTELLIRWAVVFNRGDPLEIFDGLASRCQMSCMEMRKEICEELVKRRNEVPFFVPKDLVEREFG